jgi:thiamine-phosphate pyrophosphorylase
MDEANIPRIWLMTDARMGDHLFDAIAKLPKGAGIVFRHGSLPDPDRRTLCLRVADAARSRGLLLNVAGDVGLAVEAGAAMVHRPPTDDGPLPISLPVHSIDEAEGANGRGAALAFVSPLRETRSHPGRPTLGSDQARQIVDVLDCPAIALGGMDPAQFERFADFGFYGWAGIDAWLRT